MTLFSNLEIWCLCFTHRGSGLWILTLIPSLPVMNIFLCHQSKTIFNLKAFQYYLPHLTPIFFNLELLVECQSSPYFQKDNQPLIHFNMILIQLFLYFPPTLLYFPHSIHSPQAKFLLAIHIPTKYKSLLSMWDFPNKDKLSIKLHTYDANRNTFIAKHSFCSLVMFTNLSLTACKLLGLEQEAELNKA